MTTGDILRAILKQAHETPFLGAGAYYATYRHCRFMLHPFGDHHLHRRYTCQVFPELFLSGDYAIRLFTFLVIRET